jgi:hypothetical protein
MSNEADSIELTERPDGVELSVKVVPGSSRDKIVGAWQNALRVAVSAPPEGGKANQQVVRLLAEVFGVKRGDVTITHGRTQPLKRVLITGIAGSEAREHISAALGSAH